MTPGADDDLERLTRAHIDEVSLDADGLAKALARGPTPPVAGDDEVCNVTLAIGSFSRTLTVKGTVEEVRAKLNIFRDSSMTPPLADLWEYVPNAPVQSSYYRPIAVDPDCVILID